MSGAIKEFVWFLGQCIHVGGLGIVWFLIPFTALLAVLVWAYVRAAPLEFWKLSLLGVLPLLWIFIGLWGGYFWLHQEHAPIVPNPAWTLYPILAGIWIYLIFAVGLIAYLRGARLFAALFALLNLYFMLAMSFLATMAVTGDWL